jgi:lantibiotic modifying enzyme
LPRWQYSLLNDAYDYSGLGGGNTQISPIRLPVWVNINSDGMFLDYKLTTTKVPQNLPSSQGQKKFAYDYLQEILAGFEKMYLFIDTNKEFLISSLSSPLHKFKKKEVRFIFRPSRTYDFILRRGFQPKTLKSEDLWKQNLEDLKRKPLDYIDPQNINDLIMEAEQESLLIMDIPRFTVCSSTGEINFKDQVVKKIMGLSGFEYMISRLQNFSFDNLHHQKQLIKFSLYSHSRQTKHDNTLTANDCKVYSKEVEIIKKTLNRHTFHFNLYFLINCHFLIHIFYFHNF